MSKYIKVDDAIETAINGCANWDGGYFPSMDEPIKEEFELVDAVEVVRCENCKHLGENDGYYFCNAIGIAFGDKPNWFCADGERSEEP